MPKKISINGLVSQITKFYRSSNSARNSLISYGPDGDARPHREANELVRLGVCAMDKKTRAKPMQTVLSKLEASQDFEITIFGDDCILNKPVEEWPIVDAFLSFYSTGFPTEKAMEYTALRKPYLLNDWEPQRWLLDRRKVYEILMQHNVPVPRHAVFERAEGENKPLAVEDDESIVVGGERFVKPFVEKPVDAEDHNIRIYYPRSAGGGAQQLFRKIGNKSSKFLPDCNTPRQSGSYIYEEFLATEGTDVKVYSVGQYYAHAEARKSPVVDGIVQRSADGKEVRYPVMLNADEKVIAQQVCKAFGQLCCGLDILRANGECFVCDVNGWSFVKGNTKYMEDAALIIRETILQAVCPERLRGPIIDLKEVPVEDWECQEEMQVEHLELRCVIGLFRHADRTPKQKMKMVVSNEKYLAFFKGQDPYKELKVKRPEELQSLLDTTRQLVIQHIEQDGDVGERLDKLTQMKVILERNGHFRGINRKVQLKPTKWSKSAETADDTETVKVTEALLIFKWGGELTQLGRSQSIKLGEEWRTKMYPGASTGLLRLHSTFRHDLKIYTSDEGRVQVTAAAFTKGFLQLDGSLTPILVSLCRKDSKLLDDTSAATADLAVAKKEAHSVVTTNKDLTELGLKQVVPTGCESMVKALENLGNPLTTLDRIQELLASVSDQLNRKAEANADSEQTLYGGETWAMLCTRYEKLKAEFYSKKSMKYDISKVPDVYDSTKYDCLHNYDLDIDGMEELHQLARSLADYVVPQEYGLTATAKATIGRKIAHELCRKVLIDLAIASENNEKSNQVLGRLETVHRLDTRYAKTSGVRSHSRHVRTRLYFTSESHMHAMLNILRYGVEGHGVAGQSALSQIAAETEINYLSRIIFVLYENYEKDQKDPERYMVKILFGSGVTENDSKTPKSDPNYGMEFSPLIPLNDDMILDDVESFFNKVLEQYYLDAQTDQ